MQINSDVFLPSPESIQAITIKVDPAIPIFNNKISCPTNYTQPVKVSRAFSEL